MSFNWANYLANGVPVPAGSPAPPRKEIRDFAPEELYLFVEGMKRFQNVTSNDPMSYYQIAGIHGMPYATPWPRQAPDIPIIKNTPRGFCTHSSILFLTWHRPYLALFEAQLYKHVNAIANGINDPTKQKYLDAAKSFRLPYWDWARRSVSIFPEAALTSQNTSQGPPSSASQPNANYNPLYLSPLPANADSGIKTPPGQNQSFPTTVRYPGEQDAVQALQDALQAFYQNPSDTQPERNLSERVAYIMLSYQKFAPMSNNAFQADNKNSTASNAEIWGSLEDIHNSVHDYTGGGGHMSYPQIAAFDPIFWLHHCNIDRLFAIWQALHEVDSDSTTFVTAKRSTGTSTNQRNSLETETSNLYPFRRTASEWYTSDTTKKTTDFGYTYPETAGLNLPPTPAQQSALSTRVQNYYTSLPVMIRQSRNNIASAGAHLLPQSALVKNIATQGLTANIQSATKVASQLPAADTLLQQSLGPSKPFIRDLAPNGKYLEWIVNLKGEKHALAGAYKVHVFLDDVSTDDPALWILSPHHVGTFVPFGQESDTACEKCQEDQAASKQVTAQIPLTITLVERYLAQTIPDLSVESVRPYLTKNLHWRVVLNNQIVTDRSQVPGLNVFVITNEVTLPADETQPPIYAPNVIIYPEITAGRGEGTGDL